MASRVIEAVAIAAHERLTEFGYNALARILLEHTVYLYTYPDGDPRPRLEAGSALALAGSVCASLPHSELWRLAGFGRISAVLAEVAPAPADSHLTLPIDAAFSLANERNLPILASVVETYNTVFKRDFTLQNQFNLPLSDSDFFNTLNLDFPGLEAVKTAILSGDIDTAKSLYADFVGEIDSPDFTALVGGIPNPDAAVSNDTTAKTYLECLLRLSIHPTPAIIATTEIGIAAGLFPEFRWSKDFHKLALRRYQWITEAFLHTDGFHKDRTWRAQVEAITHFARFLSVHGDTAKRAHDLEEIQTFLEKLIATCIHLSKPDCAFPPLGSLPAPDFDVIELCQIIDSNFKPKNFSYPDTTSHALPQTGCYVMRDCWETDAQYLFFDAQPSTESNHADTSRLVLHAHGRQLATGSVRVIDTELSASDVLEPQWITTPAFDFVEKWYQNPSGHYKRTIFYLRGEYYILHDLLLSEDFLSQRGD